MLAGLKVLQPIADHHSLSLVQSIKDRFANASDPAARQCEDLATEIITAIKNQSP